MRLRILHKGLILLLIPAALQGFLLFQLYTSFQEVDRLSREEEKITSVIAAEDEMVSLVSDALISSWRATKSKGGVLIGAEAFRTRMQILIAQVKQLIDDAQTNKLVELLGPLTDATYEMLKAARGPDVSDLERIMAAAPRIRAVAQQQAAIQAVKDKGYEALRVKREQTRASRARMEAQIFHTALGEFAMTLGLIFYFLQDVTKRLKVLMRNAASVPTGKPLTMHVGGGDELAYLDDVLHEASLELERAARHRKTITEMVSHDLRSPLLSANVSLDLLLRAGDSSSREDHDARVRGIKRNLTRLMSFVEDLLEIDRLESGNLKLSLEIVDLRSLADEAIENLSVLSQQKTLTLKNELPLREVVADKNRLSQVLVNLISNAIKFSPTGGEVVVSATATAQSVTVSIADQGPGIPEAELAHVFEKFHQGNLPDLPKGYGLGLFICKLIVERHGGQLGVESQVGHGARFWFSLPLDDDESV